VDRQKRDRWVHVSSVESLLFLSSHSVGLGKDPAYFSLEKRK
jgi:hypothetical protein